MQTKLIAFFLLALTLAACKPKSGEQEAEVEEQNIDRGNLQTQQAEWEEVMAIHDEVMPKMSEVERLKTALQAELPEAEGDRRTKVERIIGDLEAADQAMWDWMYGLKQLDNLRDSLEHPRIMDYLASEKKDVTEVKQKIERAIKNANDLLPNSEN